jgi:hypothetical protein
MMQEMTLAMAALLVASFGFYKYRSPKKPWAFLSRWRLLSQKKKKQPFFSQKNRSSEDHPMSAHHLNAACLDEFRGIKDVEMSREPSGAFSHLESVLNRIQSRFLSHQSLGFKGLLGDTLIDQKAFMDCFRSEKEAIVALYHCNEEKMIFVSSNVKKLLGYGPADFRIRFHDILHDLNAWQETLVQLRSRHKIYAPLALYRVSDGSSGLLCAWDAYLGHVQRGSTHYAVMLLYPAFCQIRRP